MCLTAGLCPEQVAWFTVLPHTSQRDLGKTWTVRKDRSEEGKISVCELTDLECIGAGGFGVAYRGKHPRLGTIVYKELSDKKHGERYSIVALI